MQPLQRTALGALFSTLGALPLTAQNLIPAADPDGAVRHYETYERALDFYEEGRFAEAEPLLEELLARTPADGELWYLLARARHRLGDAPGAVDAYRASLERGYRYGAWVAYQVAGLYAGMGRRDSAIVWLERSLARRWDDRPGIEGDASFASLAGDPRFRSLVARPSDPLPDRDEMWHRDIDYLVAEAKRMHAGPDRPAHSAAFDSAAAALSAKVAEFSNDRMVLEAGRLLTMLGDGHTGIFGPGSDGPLEFHATSLPLLLYEFTDGLFVVDAAEGHRGWIGAEVLAFGRVPAAEAVDSLAAFMHHDNAMTVKWLGVRFMLSELAFLEAIGATEEPGAAELTLRSGGEVRRVAFDGGPYLGEFRRKLRPPPGTDSIPLYLTRVDTSYWLHPLPERDALYFQFNQVRDMEAGPSLAGFADTLRAALEETDADHLIVDVRHNNGGNNGLLWPLLRSLVWWTVHDGDHRIWAITGRNTFSAAQNFISRLERMTRGSGDLVFVGEPSSSRPNFTGESTNLVLPHTRVLGSISNRHWQESAPDDERPFIAPRVPVGLSSAQYLSGRDPALEAIFEIIARGGV